jgi:hypothetical protein
MTVEAKRVLRRVKVADLHPAPHNPANRIKPQKLKKLMDSMAKRGLVYPIIITSGNQVIEGHRRLRCAELLEWDEIEAFVTDEAAEQLYAEINSTSAKMSGNDLLGIFLAKKAAVDPKWRRKVNEAEAILGRERLKKLYEHALSLRVYEVAKRIAKYCNSEDLPTVCRIVDWMIEFPVVGQLYKALEAGADPKKVMRCIRDRTPLNLKIA